MKIGFVIGKFPTPQIVGGAEMQAKFIAGRFSRDHEVTVFTRRLDDSPAVEVTQGYSIVRTRTVGLPGIRMLADLAVSCTTIGRRRKSLQVLLCFQTINSGVIGAMTKLTHGLPFVVWMMGQGDYQWNTRPQRSRLVLWVLRRADRILVESDYIRRELIAALQMAGAGGAVSTIDSKLSIVPSIVEHAEGRGRPDGYVLFVGRLVKVKGLELLIEAMRFLNGPRLVIVGDGPERQALERAASGLSVTFEGMLPTHEEVKRRLSGAAVLVQPSLSEGLPNTVIEAMAHGVPVVAMAVGGIPEVVRDGQTGFLLTERDPQALASRIDLLLKDRRLWERMSDACLRVAEVYSPERVLPRLETILREVVEGPRSK